MHSQTTSQDQAADEAGFLPLADNYPRLSMISTALSWGIVLLIILASNYFMNWVFLPIYSIPAFLLLAVLSIIFSYFSAKACSYRRGDFDLMFQRGLWWKKKTAVSFSRIQHIDLSHGPLERKFGLASLKFFTAGGAYSDLTIAGLAKADAETIRQHILDFSEAEYQSKHE
ncbi:MAG: PH domain-containing protein [Xanthomonadales bacterium]|nr:PH domain-containing protein [Xanthomonadales bacterium]